jgi:hypothetical protein
MRVSSRRDVLMSAGAILVANSILHFVFATCGANRAFAEECPRASSTGPAIASEVRTLYGRLIFHNGIRQWFELKLDRSQCGQSSIELVRIEGNSRALEVLRGCRVESSGAIDFSPTGYYSLDTFQDVKKNPTGRDMFAAAAVPRLFAGKAWQADPGV